VLGDKGKAPGGDLRHVLAVACQCAPSDEHIRANVTRQRPLDQEAAVSAKFAVVKFPHQPGHPDGEVTVNKTKPNISADIFNLPELDARDQVILMFKVSGKAGSQLNMANDKTPTSTTTPAHDLLNPTLELDPTFTKPRAWVEVLKGNNFAPGENGKNKFTINLVNPADDHDITVSDVVILYHEP
jgi:hypothetical protein